MQLLEVVFEQKQGKFIYYKVVGLLRVSQQVVNYERLLSWALTVARYDCPAPALCKELLLWP